MFLDGLLQPIDKLFKNISSTINDPSKILDAQNNLVQIVTNPILLTITPFLI